jgi:hypothetical protein
VATFRTVGGDAIVAVRLGAFQPYVTAGGNYMNVSFQVNALEVGDVRDRTHLHASGGTFATTGGLRIAVGTRLDLVGEVFYSPLTISQPGRDRIDGLLNVRGLVQVRLW